MIQNKLTLKDLFERKIINNITNEEKLLEAIKNKSHIYCGFDPTAKSLHLGNYVQIIALKLLSDLGLKPICLLGTGTGLIGDPSFKKEERVLLTKKQLDENCIGIKKQLQQFVVHENKGLILENNDWYKKANFIDVLRDIGKYINIIQMIHKDSVASRIESGLSFTEFSYQLLQAWDFYHLYKNYNCHVQLGGSDQWGNITTGIELIRKAETTENKSVGITFNLLVNENGEKFGKSVQGAIYLDKNLTSPYQMYQYLINQPDSILLDLFNTLTLLSNQEIQTILTQHNEKPFLRMGQKALASEVTSKIHGPENLKIVLKIATSLFKTCPTELTCIELKNLFDNIEKLKFDGKKTINSFCLEQQIFTSNREFNEFFKNKAIKINGVIVTNRNILLNDIACLKEKYILVQTGKKNFWITKKITKKIIKKINYLL